MPYKSKRTRDLQGEVVAGTGITITEQTKPDGTKEYTINNIAPGVTLTVDGTGLSLISNVLRNTMAARMGWSDNETIQGGLNWTDDNGDTVLRIKPLYEVIIGDAEDGESFFLKHINGVTNPLISGDVQIAENVASTEGVSLQTLADMSNSAITYLCDFGTNTDNNIAYCVITGIAPLDITDVSKYYTTGKPQEQIGGIDAEAIFVKQNGRYKIDVYLNCGVFDDNYIRNISFVICCFRNNGGREDIIDTEIGTDISDVASTYRYGSANMSYSIYVDLNANDAITCYAYMDTNGIANIDSNTTFLSIQKIG